MKQGYLILFMLVIKCSQISAQNATNALTLEQAEKIFLEKNLFLLAQQYNINSKKALIIQAKAYPNPTFNVDLNVIDPQNHKTFHIDSSGQKSFQVQQLILLGGKRKLEIDLAKQNSALAEAEFSELLRSLKLQLNKAFFGIYKNNVVVTNYIKQLTILDTIINAYKQQVDKGNIPLKDLIRLKTVYIRINNDKSELSADLNEQQKQLKLLLQTNQEILPIISEENYNAYSELKPLNDLQTLASANRPDLKIADETSMIAAINLKLQKRQNIPDIALNASYDQRGGAFKNQINAGLTMPIPVFNLNRGNIKAAKFDKQSMDTYLQEKKLEVEVDVKQAWLNMQRSINEFNKIKKMYNEEFGVVNNGINENFLKHNISILEYVDFVEAYNESLAEYERIKNQLAISAAEINYVTAIKIY